MAYVPVPKDLTKVKTKVMFNLTKRQLLCFSLAGALGLPIFFLLKKPLGSSVAALCMMFVMLPCFLFGVYEKNGQPMEKIICNMIQVSMIRPKQRPYRTNNFYAVLERQEALDKEVQNIVRGMERTAAPTVWSRKRSFPADGKDNRSPVPRRAEADRSCCCPGEPERPERDVGSGQYSL